MFAYDENLVTVDISSFNTLNCITFTKLFEGCYNLTVTLNGRKCSKILPEIPEYVNIKYID